MTSFEKLIQEIIFNLFTKAGMPELWAHTLNTIGLFSITITVAIAIDFLTKKIILGTIKKVVRSSKTSWDDTLFEQKVFKRLAHIVPIAFVYIAIPTIFYNTPFLVSIFQSATKCIILLLFALAIDSLLNSILAIYNSYEFSKNKPIKGYIQVLKILTYFIIAIIILSILLNKSVVYFFSGLGALAAVLMLVFKDSILGLVAGIQLTSNNMVKQGDWITSQKHSADGTVLEISLHTVKVQNWDKTITTIPTYALISDSFQNWKGMEESGGRRIKRTVSIDMKTIKFCDINLLEKLKKITILKNYITDKLNEIEKHNSSIDKSIKINGRALTNIGVFRKYLELYLRNHPKIHQELTFLVRHLQPLDKGLPIEIYIFTNKNAWAEYEEIQADIFDHIFAVVTEFELEIFQSPSGNDFKKMIGDFS